MSSNNIFSKDSIYIMFNQISKSYDRVNTILSFGLHKLWRKAVNQYIPSKFPFEILDLATGTGDQAFSILKTHKNVKITGVDLAENMLEIAKNKAQKLNLESSVEFKHGSASSLNFESSTFDFVTMSFGIRNIHALSNCFDEIFRVLKPQGAAVFLEFSLPTNKIFKKLYLFYLRYCLPKIGGLISKNIKAYTYLNETIETFPCGKNFCNLLKSHGFQKVGFHPLTFGIVNLYVGYKDL